MSGYILECPFLRSAPASSQLPNPSSAGILVPGPDRTQRTTGKRFELSFNLIGKQTGQDKDFGAVSQTDLSGSFGSVCGAGQLLPCVRTLRAVALTVHRRCDYCINVGTFLF